MEISFQLLQQQNPWWFREEMILDEEKIVEYQRGVYPSIPPFLASYPENADAILTLRGRRQIGKRTRMKLLIQWLLLERGIPKKHVFYFSLDRIGDFHQRCEWIDCYLRNLKPARAKRLFVQGEPLWLQR